LLIYLIDKYPKLEKELYTDKKKITDYVVIFVNDKPISALDDIKTKIKDGDELLFFIPISGG
jgi:molybdopterin converting factor small subunit